jgi:hypothetical protein
MKILRHVNLLLLFISVIILYSCNDNKDVIPVSAINSANINSASLQKFHRSRVSVFATGLNNPRELKFGPDGFLYVAEGGLGGTISTAGLCDSVIPPTGPYLGGNSGRIIKLDRNGNKTIVAQNLPSSQTSQLIGSLCSSVADVEFIGNTLYAILAGAGCSHGVENTPNAIIKIHSDGSWNVVADLSAYQKTHPVAHPNPDDFEPDGTWYSMTKVDCDFYAIEPNHGEMVKVTTSGNITRVIDFSAVYGHIVPTVVAFHHGNFYVANLDTFPILKGSASIYKVSRSGQSSIFATGFSSVLGLVVDKRNRIYVLEMSDVDNGPLPLTGKVVRIMPSGKRDVIADSLFFPTGMTLGPDGNLYVSNKGFGGPVPGFGEVLKIELKKFHDHDGDDDRDIADKQNNELE